MSGPATPTLAGRARELVRRAAARSARRLAWRVAVVAAAAGARLAYGAFGEAPDADAAPAPAAARVTAAAPAAGAVAAAATAAPPAGAEPPAARTVAARAADAAPRDAAPRDSAPRLVADTVVIEREVYGYAGGGRRDPFRPLIVTTVLRPFPSELRLTAVAFDPAGANSVAILRDVTTKAQHRVRAGQLVGRMRVVRIQPKAVVFAVEELGFSRRETLTLHDSLGTRQP